MASAAAAAQQTVAAAAAAPALLTCACPLSNTTPADLPANPSTWKVPHVKQWVHGLPKKLAVYCSILADNGIRGDSLVEALTNEDLRNELYALPISKLHWRAMTADLKERLEAWRNSLSAANVAAVSIAPASAASETKLNVKGSYRLFSDRLHVSRIL